MNEQNGRILNITAINTINQRKMRIKWISISMSVFISVSERTSHLSDICSEGNRYSFTCGVWVSNCSTEWDLEETADHYKSCDY